MTTPDRDLAGLLRDVSPPATFDADRVRDELEASTRRPPFRSFPGVRGPWVRWSLQLAAGIALFGLGVRYGRATAGAAGVASAELVLDLPNLVLDFTRPFSHGLLGTDASLGLTLRCPGCRPVGSGDRWAIPTWPVVATVVPGGVADEAGLQPGDEILSIDRQDVRSTTGKSPLFSLPELDFAMGYRRAGVARVALINRRITSRIIQDSRVEIRSNPGETRR
ncbi:MAG: PDZ domain-containing protein [Gemmatimonadales bacterium]